MRLPRWLTRRRERRRSVRMPVVGLVAVYWEGAAGSAHRIREISVDGAIVDTSLNWCRGTLIRMSIQDARERAVEEMDATFSELWTRVVRSVEGGFCVQFLFGSSWERQEFRRFLGAFDRRLQSEPRTIRTTITQRAGAD